MGSLVFNNVFLNDYFLLVGPKEKESKLLSYDLAIEDYYYGTKTFEHAEEKMQKVVVNELLKKNKLKEKDIDYLLAGDLINQNSISSCMASNYSISYLGMYSACATFIEELIIASLLIESNNAKKIICNISSHSLTSERQYRYPIEYGNTKPNTATCTLTGAVSAFLSNKKTNIKIISASVGKVINLGVNDVNNMGAVMAPACANTLYEHLKNHNRKLSYYDVILTGDLGKVGINILKDYYEEVYHGKITNIIDAGSSIYFDKQEMYSGGSGPCCLPLYLFSNIINQKKYKKILLLGTGSLHNTIIANRHETIPSVCHAIELEVIM